MPENLIRVKQGESYRTFPYAKKGQTLWCHRLL